MRKHPKIIEEFNTPLSDTGEQVVAINMSDSQDSNRYCCRSDVQNPRTFVKIDCDGTNCMSYGEEKITFFKIDYGKDGWFEYMFQLNEIEKMNHRKQLIFPLYFYIFLR